jgi:hypothetical protein
VLGLCSIVLLAAVAGSRFTSDVVKADSQVTSDVVIWPSPMSLPFTHDNLRSSLYFELLSGLSTVHFLFQDLVLLFSIDTIWKYHSDHNSILVHWNSNANHNNPKRSELWFRSQFYSCWNHGGQDWKPHVLVESQWSLCTCSWITRKPSGALARLKFICERVRFRFYIRLYLFVWESLRFRVYID